MWNIRKAEERGSSNLDWLKSKHTFSFSSYYDPQYMGFMSLRVINDDRVAPGGGFNTHPHDNMEIISYVLDGALEHKDSMGNGSIIRPGDVQRMSAGTGVTHSEYNHFKEKELHFLQIWFLPDTLNIKPSYEQKTFRPEEKRGKFLLVASKNGRENSVSIGQDVDMSIALIDGKEKVTYTPQQNRALWIHLARGEVTINGYKLLSGDGIAVINQQNLTLNHGKNAEVIVFDLKNTL